MYSKHNTTVMGQKVPPKSPLNYILATPANKAATPALLHSTYTVPRCYKKSSCSSPYVKLQFHRQERFTDIRKSLWDKYQYLWPEKWMKHDGLY